MNKWLTPSIVFVLGLLLGVGAMYLLGVRVRTGAPPLVYYDQSGQKVPVCQGLPDVAGISGSGLSVIKDNVLVDSGELRLTLSGLVGSELASDNTFMLVGGNRSPITIQLTAETDKPSGALSINDKIRIEGTLQGERVVAESITRIQ